MGVQLRTQFNHPWLVLKSNCVYAREILRTKNTLFILCREIFRHGNVRIFGIVLLLRSNVVYYVLHGGRSLLYIFDHDLHTHMPTPVFNHTTTQNLLMLHLVF